MKRGIPLLLFILLSSSLYGQKQLALTSYSSETHPDSLKKKKILRQWNLSPDFSEEVSIPFDTIFSLFHRIRLADRYSPINATLGNYGLPFYQINFFDRITDPDEFLYSYYYPVMHMPDKALFMNTQVPFTEIVWSYAGPRQTSEQTFRVRHSQNINRYLNFGLIYDIIFSLGQYNYQQAEDKTFTFYTSYTGPRYKAYFAAGINNMLDHENGGISDKTQLGQVEPRLVPVNLGGLNEALTTFKNRNLLLVQRYTIGGGEKNPKDSLPTKKTGFLGLSGTFSHILVWDRNFRKYDDSYPAGGFYDKVLVTDKATHDSLFSNILRNTIRFDFTTDESRKFKLGGGVGIRNELLKFSHITPLPYIYSPGDQVWKKSNNVLVGRLYNNIGDKLGWKATGEMFLTGYRAGDFNFNGEIAKSFDFRKGRASWLIDGSMMNRQPSFWYESWGGNNFKWNNNFSKEFRIDLGTSFSYPVRNALFKFNYAIIKNYLDFDTAGYPSQHTGGISVAAVTIRKDLRAWKFHLNNDIVVQQSSNPDVLDLPLLALKTAGYFEHVFRFSSTGGHLSIQTGVDLTYHTLYHAYAYMPATGRFYRQDRVQTGNYPFVDVFLNLKIQRTRIFLMFDHVNAGLMGTNYEMIPDYPMNIRMFRYGLAWTFYN